MIIFTMCTTRRRCPRLVIDTDVGTDDALALILCVAAERRGDAEILGVTCVHGNTDLPNVCVNTLKMLHTLRRLDFQNWHSIPCTNTSVRHLVFCLTSILSSLGGGSKEGKVGEHYRLKGEGRSEAHVEGRSIFSKLRRRRKWLVAGRPRGPAISGLARRRHTFTRLVVFGESGGRWSSARSKRDVIAMTQGHKFEAHIEARSSFAKLGEGGSGTLLPIFFAGRTRGRASLRPGVDTPSISLLYLARAEVAGQASTAC
uniref:Inosine/uridine-preferring nucleoside hydrolase domain-containing protein n=1 Tax=Timema shepardi TaxID=629360 RepID=A0A7R9B635_TIMSH|nr:unnamed protein product [Timema shepardi]